MQLILKDQSIIELPDGSTGKDLAEKLNLKGPHQALAACVNGKTIDLSTPLKDGDKVILWSFDNPEGKEIYWHTSAHVLAQAILRLFPDAKPTIGPPIENGFYYDFADLTISDADFDKIEKEMKAIVKENYLSQREDFKDKKTAIEAFKNNKYKCEIIKEVDESEPLSGYRQGEFFDLCRGPHLHNLGKIKALKILKTSGAYWRGDANNEMLTRIYAITFPDKKLLKEYLHQVVEAKKRDHKVIGPKLDLFSLKEEAPGMPFIHPKGVVIWNGLIDYLRQCLKEANYVEIKTPSMMTKDLWVRSGHWSNYREHMYTSKIEDREFAIKPMNCPGGMLYYKSTVHSYRELPLRVAEIGHVHRYEPHGSLSGLFRVRSFHQDDAHVFMKPSDIKEETLFTIKLFDKIYSTFGLEYHLALSTKPDSKTIGTDEEWQVATEGLKGALDAYGRDYRIDEGDGAFYGPKIDFHIKDALKRTWQCGTIQLDMSLPERFDLEYTSADGSRQRPIMIHRAIYGSIERFFGILIEHYGGRFPMWLSPLQIRIITVADRHYEYGLKILESFKSHGFLCDIDDSQESVSKKVRNAQLSQINYILTVGDKEVENSTVNLRTRENAVLGEKTLEELTQTFNSEIVAKSETSPFKD